MKRAEEVSKVDTWLELAVEAIVHETTEQLCGDKHLESALKQSLAPQKEQSSAAVAAMQAAAINACLTSAARNDRE